MSTNPAGFDITFTITRFGTKPHCYLAMAQVSPDQVFACVVTRDWDRNQPVQPVPPLVKPLLSVRNHPPDLKGASELEL